MSLKRSRACEFKKRWFTDGGGGSLVDLGLTGFFLGLSVLDFLVAFWVDAWPFACLDHG